MLDEPRDIVINDDHAYIISGQKVQVIDISDPYNLKPAGLIHNEMSGVKFNSIRAFQIVGNYAYFIDSDQGTLQIIDITDPNNLKPTNFIQSKDPYGDATRNLDSTEGFQITHPEFLKISGNYAYIMNSLRSSFQVIDISNPYDLKPLDFIKGSMLPYETEQLRLKRVNNMAIAGNYAYILDGELGKIQVVDISDPTKKETVVEPITDESESNVYESSPLVQPTVTNTANKNSLSNGVSIEAPSNSVAFESQPTVTNTANANTQTNSVNVVTPSNMVSRETHSTGKSNSAKNNVNYYPVSSNKLTQSSKNNFKVDEDFVITLSDDSEHEFKIEAISTDSFTASINGQSKKLENGVEYNFGEYKITPQVDNNEVQFQIEALSSIGIAKESTLAASKQADTSTASASTSTTDQGEDNKTKFYWFGGAAIAAYLFFHKKDPASGLNKIGKEETAN